ncbi:protein CutA homolog isoform 2-T2 [Glossophaga mutica]
MDRLGSRCPLPGYPRSSVLICLLILTASLLTYPLIRTLSLQLHSAVTGSFVSGTYSIVFVNCPNEQIARDIARAVLGKKLAASVNILPEASSLAWLRWFFMRKLGKTTGRQMLATPEEKPPHRCRPVRETDFLKKCYFWNGEIEEATEILLLMKTKTSKVHMLSSYVRLVHPFEIPEIFSLPMDQGDVHYLKWLKEGMEED